MCFVSTHLEPENRSSPPLKRRRSIPGPLSMLPMCGPSSRGTHKRKLHSTDKAFPRGKIPVFCAIIEKIDTALPIARAVLQDGTGKIGCSIDKNVVRKYRRFLCVGAILILKQISLFSLNQKTFYLNITSPNVSRIFLDASSIDSRLLGSRIAEDVSICGPDFPLTSPPLSVNDLRALVVECLAPLSPSPLPAHPLFKPIESVSPPRNTSRCLKKSPHRLTPTQSRDRNRRLISGRLTSDIATSPPSTSGSKSLPPFRCRRGIRSLLRSAPNATNSQPSATDTPKSVPRVQNPAASSPTAKSVIRLNNKEDKPGGATSPMPSDWMEDDMDNLLASMVE
ncbi:Homologou recombination OB-fold protein [Taenia crassiceps]|uniref:Homologou recombination OB-fold protein n=1 Tax=Taenia crassiceps TaxID=6207 RepID=A0ABR4QNP5_9CEST